LTVNMNEPSQGLNPRGFQNGSRLLKNRLLAQAMDGLPDCETKRVEQFVRFGRNYEGQIVVEKAMDGLFQHTDRDKNLGSTGQR
jgi:hypothetical protein